MAKKQTRTWPMVLSLGIPLVIVVLAAMLASFTALYDVARVNGVVIPWLLPVVVDVGMIGSNAATVYFRKLGIKGRWVADVIFLSFAAVSVYANITHAWLAADLTQTSLITAVIIAAIFPAGQLGVTHMVMMLIPDEKERARLQRDRAATEARERPAAQPATHVAAPAAPVRTAAPSLAASSRAETVLAPPERPALHAVPLLGDAKDEAVRQRILDFVAREGKRPTGSQVSDWRGGGDRRTGTRFMERMENDGILAPISSGPGDSSPQAEPAPAASNS
ncbi:hypothetical protein AB3K78_01365 [Leucobacter sp. HNU]|uniref:hypothetical protein n=1 Tax=Leucobacter sp. HNU TaxID=3236805 RepID=UPI003A807D43